MRVLKYIQILITQLICIVCFAQTKEIDSLKNVLPLLKDTSRIDCLNELSAIYLENTPSYRLENNLKIVDTALYYAELAKREAEKINYIHGIADGLSLKSKVAFTKYDNYVEAENLAREAIFLYRKTRNKKKLNRAYHELGRALYAQSYFEKAINNFAFTFAFS